MTPFKIRLPTSSRTFIVAPFEAFVRRKLDQLTDARPDRTKALESRIAVLESFLQRLRQWDQMNPPMTGDHAAFAASIDALLQETDR